MKVENNQVFSKIDDFSNKGLHRAEQNKFNKKLRPVGIAPVTLGLVHLVLHKHKN